MHNTPKAVLFDFNGTLNDMSVLMAQNQCVGREVFGLHLSPEDVSACWGQPAEKFYADLFGRDGSAMSWQDMRAVFQGYDALFPRRLLPGVPETLDALDGADILTGVVTSGQRDKVLAYMQQAGLDPARFRLVHTAQEIGDDIAANRPILTKALGELACHGIEPAEVMFVGDESVNVADAQAAGTDFTVVANGTVSQERLLEQGVPAAKLLATMRELPAHLAL